MDPGRVLVVDDSADDRALVTSYLEEGGAEVLVAGSGREALNVLEKVTPDLAIVDLRMPEMDGLTFLKEKQSEQFGGTVIMMSAYGSIDTAVECMKVGAYDYISKPFRPDEILLTVRKAEERLHLRDENVKLKKDMKR